VVSWAAVSFAAAYVLFVLLDDCTQKIAQIFVFALQIEKAGAVVGCELGILRGLHLDRFDGVFLPCSNSMRNLAISAGMLVVPCAADAASFFKLEGARQFHSLALAEALNDASAPLAEESAEVVRQRASIDARPSLLMVAGGRREVKVLEMSLVLALGKQERADRHGVGTRHRKSISRGRKRWERCFRQTAH